MISARVLALFIVLVGCDNPPATVDAGSDAGGTDVGATPDAGTDAGATSCLSGTACSMFPSVGCGAGEACSYAFASGTRTNECVTPGAGTLGVSCEANADCGTGLSCLGGFCVELCCPTAPSACGAGTECVGVTVGPMGMGDDIGLCACTVGGAACPAGHYCDPLAGDVMPGAQGVCLAQGSCDRIAQDCPDGQGCYGTVRECASAGTAVDGEACVAHSDCVPGFWCRAGGSGGVCSSYCEVGGAACPAGSACMSFGDDQPQVGGCYPI